jgi:hypothetical protein
MQKLVYSNTVFVGAGHACWSYLLPSGTGIEVGHYIIRTHISPPDSSWTPGVFYTYFYNITTPIVSALKNYYR